MPTIRATTPRSARPPQQAAVAAFGPPDPALLGARGDRALAALRYALAVLFVAAGTGKLVGLPETVAQFGTIENVAGVGPWLRAATGLLEVLGGVLLGARASAGVGAVLLGAVTTAAALTHVCVLGDAPMVPAVLLAALGVVAYAHRFALRAFAAVLERNL